MFEFAIFPDNAPRPSAVFTSIEDAIDFGVRRYGPDRFSIRHCELTVAKADHEPIFSHGASRWRS